MIREIRNFIGGDWIPAAGGHRFQSLNPADTRETVAEAPLSGRPDMDRAVAAARVAFHSWHLVPAPRRGEILYRAAELLARHKAELGELVTREMGKILIEGLGDVQEAIDMAFYMGGEGRRLLGYTAPVEMPNKFGMAVRDPSGVVGIITPWNFPMAIPAWKTCSLRPALRRVGGMARRGSGSDRSVTCRRSGTTPH